MAERRHSRQPPARRGIRARWPITSPGRGGRLIAHGVSRGLQAQPTQAAPAGAKERLGRPASHVTIGLPRHELLSPLPGLRAARPKNPRLAPWATALSPRLGLDDDAVDGSPAMRYSQTVGDHQPRQRRKIHSPRRKPWVAGAPIQVSPGRGGRTTRSADIARNKRPASARTSVAPAGALRCADHGPTAGAVGYCSIAPSGGLMMMRSMDRRRCGTRKP